MKKLLILFKRTLFILALQALGFSTLTFAAASYTNVTITLTDSSAQVWANATWRAQFTQPFGNPHIPTNNGVSILAPQTGTADSLGTFTVTLDDNLVVTPSGSRTTFTLCPNATVAICSTFITTVTGASQNLSVQASAAINVPIVNARPVIFRAYKDSEAFGGYGSQYINTIDNTLRVCNLVICSGTGWVVSSPTTNNPTFTGTTTIDILHVTGISTFDSVVNFKNCANFIFSGADLTHVCPQAGGPFNVNLPTDSGTLALLNSPIFTGDPQAPTPSTGDNDTSIATTAFVKNQNYITAASAPVTSVFGRTGAVVATSGDYSVGEVTGAAPLASPTFTGVPAAPTAASGTNTTQIATTAFVHDAFTSNIKILNATGPFSCSGDQTVCEFTLNWPSTFGDTNYTAVCDPVGPSETSGSSSLANGGHGTLTATTINVYAVSSGSAAKSYSNWTCYGIHN